MTAAASSTGTMPIRTVLLHLQQLAKKEPIWAEQKPLEEFRQLSQTQQVATIQHMAQLGAKQAENRTGILQLISLLVTNRTS